MEHEGQVKRVRVCVRMCLFRRMVRGIERDVGVLGVFRVMDWRRLREVVRQGHIDELLVVGARLLEFGNVASPLMVPESGVISMSCTAGSGDKNDTDALLIRASNKSKKFSK